jgi:DNA-binding MarR family transcriptional regulator
MPADPPQPLPPLRSQAEAAFARCAAWNTRLAARRLTAFLEARLAPAGLSASQFGLMGLLAAARDDSLGALAERAGLDQSSLSRALEGLARAGWVEVASLGPDRRRRAAWLTETGARRLAEAMPLWQAAQEELDRLLEPALVARLADATAGLRDSP